MIAGDACPLTAGRLRQIILQNPESTVDTMLVSDRSIEVRKVHKARSNENDRCRTLLLGRLQQISR